MKSNIAITVDTELFARIRDGDPEALGEAFELHAGRLYGVALRISGSAVDAEDVLQDVFLGLPEALRRVGIPREPGRWLTTLAVRRTIDMLRGGRRRSEQRLDESQPDVKTSSVVDAIALERALATLPASLRSVLVLKEVEGYSHAEIATLLGIGESASEVRLFRAKKALRKILRSES